MRKNVTLKQIAKELNVSVSTVSKALRDNEEISLETREKIQAFAKLYNYKPNSIALNLRNKSSQTIAIIIPQIVNHFFTKVIQGIESIANERNYNVIIAVSNDSFEKEVLNMQTLVNGSIDGFILSVAKETLKRKDYHHFNETISQGVPIVLFDRQVDEIHCDKVVVDDEKGAKNATQKLIETGCKKIVFITTEDFVSVGSLRKKGYCNALQENNLSVDETLIISVKDVLNSDEIEPFIFDELEKLINQDTEELYLTEAIGMLMKKRPIYAKMIEGIHYDTGNKFNWLKTNIEFGLHDKEIGSEMRKYLTGRLKKK